MEMKKYCPIAELKKTGQVWCDKDCAWYLEDRKACAIAVIARMLFRINWEINNVVEKLDLLHSELMLLK